MKKFLSYLFLITFFCANSFAYGVENYDDLVNSVITDVENNDIKSAKEKFETFINSKNQNLSSKLLYYYAKLCIIDNDYDKAIENLLSAIEQDDSDPLFYLELGKAYLKKEDFLKAVNAFEYALSVGGDKGECYNYIGLSNYKRGNLKTAEEYFIKALEISPYNIFYLNNLAMSYKSLNDEEKYINTVRKIENIIPNSPEEYAKLGIFFFDNKDYESARKILNEGVKKYPNNTFLKEMFNKLNKT